MSIASKYSPKDIENKWYKFWDEKGLFSSRPDDREPYVIVIPPPNVTGVLHMGHMLNNTIQDILVRRARMLGKNALWVPGTDHASIATEAKVVAKLKEEGIHKSDLSREEFLKHAWDWTHKHGGIILQQLKRLGASCDWNRTCFTMDDARYESVIDVFIDLYEKGLIYRGVRMVNWDPEARTAVSDEEVVYTEEQSKLYHINYPIIGEEEFVTIATTRPETILGDTAVCVNPKDERYLHLKGKKVLVPLINREIPIIEDDYVDMEFGTGCLKITPAHDVNDYEIGLRHNLEVIDILNDDGTLNEKAEIYIGEDRDLVRKKIANQLQDEGYLKGQEDYTNKVGRSERTDAVIEPKISMQWFLKMSDISKPALEAVMNDDVKLHPAKFKNTYRHWMENVKDWCISRQLWWGHRIPVYYINNTNEFVVAKTQEEAIEKARKKSGDNTISADNLSQDEDVMDTWFSSWLWPISVFDGIRYPDNEDIKYYYPTNDLVTAPEILFFWVARMILAGYEYRNDKPFKNVYLTGIVRDIHRRKMSKSLGNSPDPIELIDKYSADGVRVGMLLCSPAGNDLLFDENLTEQGRNFANKIWNAFRLVKSLEVSNDKEQTEAAKEAIEWFTHRFSQAITNMDKAYDSYRLSEALMVIYKLFWDDFASWYLEAIKPGYQQPMSGATYTRTLNFFDRLLRVLHPFMPFITEEIWHLLQERGTNESIMVAEMPKPEAYNEKLLSEFEMIREVVGFVRNTRQSKGIANKDMLQLYEVSANKNIRFKAIAEKLANLESFEIKTDKSDGGISYISRGREFYLILDDKIDKNAELAKLKEELEYTKGFLNTVLKKLQNERFVQNAPENVVAAERKKQADAEGKIKLLQEQIESMF
ncbi:MAG: valine--tRNA ligase [Bacteroidetes bacterium]|nr:valine--tRNA ligase [Bacteroidota bacterium]